jgi:hypothetical protein
MEMSEARYTTTVSAPRHGGELLDLEVRWHLAQAERALEKLNEWDVRLEAVTKIDGYGNRTARVFPLRSRWAEIDGKRQQVWERVELDSYHADGTYVSFNTERFQTPDPAWTAKLVKISIDKAKKEQTA